MFVGLQGSQIKLCSELISADLNLLHVIGASTVYQQSLLTCGGRIPEAQLLLSIATTKFSIVQLVPQKSVFKVMGWCEVLVP